MDNSYRAGGVIYTTQPDMAHGTRPMVVLAVNETDVMLMPIPVDEPVEVAFAHGVKQLSGLASGCSQLVSS